ncbi:hypothetical protein RUND412_003751 [Rhizina undulata]
MEGPAPTQESFLEISKATHTIAGINVHVYGLKQLPLIPWSPDEEKTDVYALYLLHPRLETYGYMESIARSVLGEWAALGVERKRGLICVAFDQRNHGEREVNSLSNLTWRDSNPTHAADMFSIYHGTSLDLNTIVKYLPSYIFPTRTSPYRLAKHLVAGVSLGGHAAHLSLFNDPRISGGVAIIGCPDYVALMQHRASKSRLESYSNVNGEGFLYSEDFPEALVDAVFETDPAAEFIRSRANPLLLAEGAEREEKMARLKEKVKGKKMLMISGGADKLVPYDCSSPFLECLKQGIENGELELELQDRVYEDVGHKCTPEMVEEMAKFVVRVVEEGFSK